MKMNKWLSKYLPAAVVCSLVSAAATAQSPQAPQAPASDLTSRSIKAVGYVVGGSDTDVDLNGTGLISGAVGEANVEAKQAVTTVEAKVKGLRQPSPLGTDFLAYVLWAVSPDGRTVNLGEIRTDEDGEGELKATTQLQSFSLFVTAEPYAAVRQPSELLVLENDIRKNTKGRLFPVENYKLLKRSVYQRSSNPLALSLDLKNVPIEMYQARNSVEIAKARGAEKYAAVIFSKAQGSLSLAEAALARKADKKELISLARQTTQFSEDARAATAEAREGERVATERAAAAATAKAQAEAKAAAEAAIEKQRADEAAKVQKQLADAREAQLKAEAAARQAEAQRQEAQLKADAAARETQLKVAAATREAELKAAADAREAAERDARTRAEAEAAARDARAKADIEQARKAAADLRAQLLGQFNRILETKDTPRGLVITMADVLFDTGKFDLRPPTREALAKISGVILSHQGLKLEVEGYTDSTGSDEFNMTLSQQRADGVRGYLVQQGLAAEAVAAKGLGKATPVADNSTAEGRKKNRRVELIVSGEAIGMTIGR
jgi:outer membrane protein OmpA-like peptidoglycan-associated protein